MHLKSAIRVNMYIRELMTLIQCTADAEKDVSMKKLKLEEAIATLQDMKVNIPVPKAAIMQTKRNVALDMAIDALKCSEMPNGSDTIYRQAAIDAINEYMVGKRCDTDGTMMARLINELVIKQLPPVEPQIIRCKDCKNWDTTWTNDFSPNYHYCPMVDGVRKEDWFCADAERRTE